MKKTLNPPQPLATESLIFIETIEDKTGDPILRICSGCGGDNRDGTCLCSQEIQ